jgi:hypothetical protein
LLQPVSAAPNATAQINLFENFISFPWIDAAWL